MWDFLQVSPTWFTFPKPSENCAQITVVIKLGIELNVYPPLHLNQKAHKTNSRWKILKHYSAFHRRYFLIVGGAFKVAKLISFITFSHHVCLYKIVKIQTPWANRTEPIAYTCFDPREYDLWGYVCLLKSK